MLGGIILAFAPGLPPFTLDPDIILVVFLPPLLQASTYSMVWRDFRAELRPILLLAVDAVIFTTAVVGVVAHAIAPALPWAACFALGAIVSPARCRRGEGNTAAPRPTAPTAHHP